MILGQSIYVGTVLTLRTTSSVAAVGRGTRGVALLLLLGIGTVIGTVPVGGGAPCIDGGYSNLIRHDDESEGESYGV